MDDFRKAIVTLLPRLRRFACLITHGAVDPDDLVHATIEKCLAKQDHWQAGTRLDSWMYRIMQNIWIDEMRLRARRRDTNGPQAEAERVADPFVVDPETRIQALSVEAAVAELPPEQREVVALVLIDGMAYRDACGILGIPIGTLTSRLSRARAALAARLEPELCDEA